MSGLDVGAELIGSISWIRRTASHRIASHRTITDS
jgi:hypothetical protein